MPFTQSAYGGITRHLGDSIKVYGEKENATPEPSRRQRCFATSVTGTYDNNVVSLF
jgi:hypothetical protein